MTLETKHEETIEREFAASNAAVSGRATGVLFFAGFGSLWLAQGLSALHWLTPLGIVAIAAIAATLAIPAVMLLRTAGQRSREKGLEEQESPEDKHAFARINFLQWAAIFAAVAFFNALHRTEYLTPVITFIVGAHLIPLARLFSYRPHLVTGSLLMFWATIMVMVFAKENMTSVGAIGTAMILLGSAAWTLTIAGRAAKADSGARPLSAHSV
jgi:hypothetical protein